MSDPTQPTSPDAQLGELFARANELIQELSANKAQYEKLIAAAVSEHEQISSRLAESAGAVEFAKAEQFKIKTAREQIDAEIVETRDKLSAISGEVSRVEAAREKFEQTSANADQAQAELADQQKALAGALSETSQKQAIASASMEEIKKIGAAVSEQNDAIAASVLKISESKEKLEKVAADALEARNKLAENELEALKKVGEVRAATVALDESRQALNSVVDDLTRIKSETNAGSTAALVDVQSIAETKTKFESLKAEADTAHESLVTREGQAIEKIAEIDATYARIRQERSDLFDDKEVDGKVVTSVVGEIRAKNAELVALVAQSKQESDALRQDFNVLRSDISSTWDGIKADFTNERVALLANSKSEFTTLKSELTAEIRRLLPGAGAAGLSWAYYDAKVMYGPGKFEYEGNRNENYHIPKLITSWLMHIIQYRSARVGFYVIFIGPLLLVAYYFYELMNFMLQHPQSFNVNLIFFRALISLPLATVSLFGWSSIRLYRRLYEEYNHKQRVMELYESFKKEIEMAGTDEQKKALLTIMLSTVGDKPTLAMHKYDKTFEIQWPTLSLSELFGGQKSPPSTE